MALMVVRFRWLVSAGAREEEAGMIYRTIMAVPAGVHASY